MIKLILFVGGSIVIIGYSWKSFTNLRSHGFPRFFAFEAILGLILINIDYWFNQLFTFLHILSWLCLIASGYLVYQGSLLLRSIGKPQGNFENTTHLVKAGVYRYIRHPLYSSLLFLSWGVYLKEINLKTTILLLVATVALIVTARFEESENLNKFGQEYTDYINETRMFIPYLL
jgi:protein-S-isoprenylcysteine O-methyltransferase Ste14